MTAAATASVSGEEDLALFTHMMNNWTGYLEGYLSYKWLLLPLVLLYSHCLIIIFIAYFTSLLLYIWKKKNNLPEDTTDKLWDLPRKGIAYFVDTIGKILHGYEVIGMENLPEGPGIIVYYHGALATDYAFFLARIYIQKRRLCQSVTHHAMHQMSGIQQVLKAIGCKNSNRDECVKVLKEGGLLGIAPGGLREGNFSDEYYNLIWGNHIGFAKVALVAQVPIIPMFTENLREGYRVIGRTGLTRWLFEHIGFLLLPAFGGIPVKLRTYIGEPIPYDPNVTAAELAQKTKAAVESLRDKHQKIPGSILHALLGRFEKLHKDN